VSRASAAAPPPNPLLDPRRRRVPAGVVVVIVLVLALAAGVGVQYYRGHSAVKVDANANAFACAAAAGKPRGYSDALYAGFDKTWTNGQLLELGQQLGIDDSTFQQCVNDDAMTDWLASVTKAADDRGVTGTPTVFVNGKMLGADQLTPEGIKAAVGAA
jgi:2-hydroxychromene-2-carboxylate isomerase